jgi:hypothetical protein
MMILTGLRDTPADPQADIAGRREAPAAPSAYYSCEAEAEFRRERILQEMCGGR